MAHPIGRSNARVLRGDILDLLYCLVFVFFSPMIGRPQNTVAGKIMTTKNNSRRQRVGNVGSHESDGRGQKKSARIRYSERNFLLVFFL